MPTKPESASRRGRTIAVACVVTATCCLALFIARSGALRRYSEANLTALAHRINDPAGYVAPTPGFPFQGRPPVGWEGLDCGGRCTTMCPTGEHSSAAAVDLTRSRVRVDRLVVNDYDPPLTADDMDMIMAGEIVAMAGECIYRPRVPVTRGL